MKKNKEKSAGRTWLLDIEVYNDLFLCSWQDFHSEEIVVCEISQRKDDREKLFKSLKEFKGFLVTFNGLHYDEVVLSYFMKNWKRLKDESVRDFCYDIKDFSDMLIQDENSFEKTKEYKWFKRPWKSIDVYTLGWSKGLRISKQISLKALAVQLRHPEIQELPFEVNHYFEDKDEEIDALIHYNTVNDIGVLRKIFIALEEEIKLRGYILKTYGLECWSLDAPKIVSVYLLDVYCSATFPWDIWEDDLDCDKKYMEYVKMVRNQRYEPKSFTIGEHLPEVQFKTKPFQELLERFKKSRGGFKEDFPVVKNDTAVMLAPSVGGIHSVNNNQYFESKDGWVIVDADVASLYPTLFKEYGFLRDELKVVLDKYCEIIDDRIEAKRNGDKVKDKFLKLVLNSFSGLVDSNVTWLYSPEKILALRVTGQLIQLKFIEELTELQGVKVLFTNTDGTLCMIKEELLPKYCEIAQNIAKEFRIVWEFTINKKIVFSNTNSYISVIDESFMLDDDANMINHKTGLNKIKRKGSVFRYGGDVPLGDSTNEEVIPRALEAYLVHGISPEEFISNPEKNGLTIFDFCCAKKVNRNFEVFFGEEKVQNINRYYFCRKGEYLMKKRKNSSENKQHLHKGNPVMLLNNYDENKPLKDYDIDFKYYIAKTNKIIQEVEHDLRNPSLFG